MKFIYTILFFMIFVNVISFLLLGLGIIDFEHTAIGDVYDENMTGDELFKDLSDVSLDDITSFSLTNVDLLLIVGGGIALAILFRHPAPFAVGLFAGIFINTFRRSTDIFFGFDTNPYMVAMGILGVVVLIVITIIEYFTQGDV